MSQSSAAAASLIPGITSLGVFNYASLSSMMIFWQVPPEAVQPFLEGTGLAPGMFDGKALVSLNFERYASLGNNYFTPVTETEFSVVVYPLPAPALLPVLTVDQYLSAGDQTKTYGNFRLNVPCNDPTAVQAGSQKYGEIKFVTQLQYNVPNVNAPTVSDWWIRCLDPTAGAGASSPYIFDLHANFQGNRPQVSNFSPVSAYADLKQADGKSHLVLSSRVVFGPFQRWTPNADTVQLTIGNGPHPMTAQMTQVFGNAAPVGILLYESSPAATSAHSLLTLPVSE